MAAGEGFSTTNRLRADGLLYSVARPRNLRTTSDNPLHRLPKLLPLLLAVLLGACAGQMPTPVHPPLRDAEARRPVVLVPGITGSVLRERGTGKVVWGSGKSVFFPRDGAYALVLPLGDEDAGKDLEAVAVLEEVSLLGVIKKEAYAPIARMLEENGYRRGDLTEPRRGDTLFLFAYDWRRSNEEAVRRLAEGLERLRRAEGRERLEVDLICQSNGAHICRYLAKYGATPFADAEAGRLEEGSGVQVAKVVLVGTSNGGSLRILRELDRGRTYFPLGRKFQPEALFTLPGLYQDLPAYLDGDGYFLDEEGGELPVDLYDPEAWEEYGWSIFGDAARRRAGRRPELFGGMEEWRELLRRTLADARRLQELLRRDVPGFGPTRYYLIQNPSEPTPERAVLVSEDDEWRLLFTGDKELEKRPELLKRASTVGDGHASLTSQMWLSPQEAASIASDPFHVEGKHFELILNPKSLRRILKYLHDGVVAPETTP